MSAASPLGRAQALAALADRLSKPGLLSVVGPAGVGKSTLLRFGLPQGRFVHLEGVVDGDGWLDAAARALEVRHDGELEDWSLLWGARAAPVLVLDGAESRLEELASGLPALRRHWPELTVVLGTRVRLGLDEEQVFELPPLDPAAAHALFERSCSRHGVQPGASEPAVRAMLESLDHLPLAIELVAARLRYRRFGELWDGARVDIDGLFTGARDRTPRHRSLRAALDASWSVCPAPLREASRRLAEFETGFSPEDGAAYLEAHGLAPAEPLLDGLRDHSLLWMRALGGRTRLGLYDAVRQFVRREAPSEGLAPWWAARGLARRPGLHGPNPAELVGWLGEEQDNLLACIQRVEAESPGVAADLVASLFPRIGFCGPFAAHEDWLARGFGWAERSGDPERMVRAALDLGWSYLIRGMFEDGMGWVLRGRELLELPHPLRIEIEVMYRHITFRRDGVPAEDMEAWAERAEKAGLLSVAATARQQIIFQGEAEAPSRALELAAQLGRWARAHGLARVQAICSYLCGRHRPSSDPRAATELAEAARAFVDMGEPIYAAVVERARADRMAEQQGPRAALEHLRACEQSDMAHDGTSLALLRLGQVRFLLETDQLAEAKAGLRALEPLLGRLPSLPVQREAAELRPRLERRVRVQRDGGEVWIDGDRIDLRRRRAVRRILARLAEARLEGRVEPLLWEELCEAGWPEREPEEQGGRARAYTAVWTLRSLGLGPCLETTGEGYRLVDVEVV